MNILQKRCAVGCLSVLAFSSPAQSEDYTGIYRYSFVEAATAVDFSITGQDKCFGAKNCVGVIDPETAWSIKHKPGSMKIRLKADSSEEKVSQIAAFGLSAINGHLNYDDPEGPLGGDERLVVYEFKYNGLYDKFDEFDREEYINYAALIFSGSFLDVSYYGDDVFVANTLKTVSGADVPDSFVLFGDVGDEYDIRKFRESPSTLSYGVMCPAKEIDEETGVLYYAGCEGGAHNGRLSLAIRANLLSSFSILQFFQVEELRDGIAAFEKTFSLSQITVPEGYTLSGGDGLFKHMGNGVYTIGDTPVSEPAALALFGLGLAGLAVARRRRRA